MSTSSLRERSREGQRWMALSLASNVFLAVAKLAGGLLGRSQALIADGIESSLDIVSTVMMWAAIKYAERPPDSEHPYGHGKMESMAAVIGSLILMGAGVALGLHSVGEIVALQHGVGEADIPAPFTLVILILTIVSKEGLFRLLHQKGKAIESRAVQTEAFHHRSDAMTSLAAGIGITAALIGGPAWASADDWAALFSCGIIISNGLQMLRGAMGEILDEQIPSEQVREIIEQATAVEGVSNIEKCRVRKSGFVRIADLHVRVPGDCTVREGHRIAHEVKDKLLAAGFHLADVTVHIEPDN